MLDRKHYQQLLEAALRKEINALLVPGLKLPKTPQGIKSVHCAAVTGYHAFYNVLSLAEIDELGLEHPFRVRPEDIVSVD